MYKFNGIIIVLLTVFLLAGCSLAGCSASIVQTEEPITLTYSNIVNTAAGHNEYKTIEMQPEDIHKGDLILINSQYAYNFDDNQDLVSVYDYKNSAYKVSGINVMLNKNAVTAFNNMMKDFQAAKSDNSVIVLDGYNKSVSIIPRYFIVIISRNLNTRSPGKIYLIFSAADRNCKVFLAEPVIADIFYIFLKAELFLVHDCGMRNPDVPEMPRLIRNACQRFFPRRIPQNKSVLRAIFMNP